MVLLSSAFTSFNMYGFLIACAMLVGVIVSYYLARERGYHEDLVFWVAIICIPCAIVGARLYYVIFDDRGFDYWTFKRIVGYEDGKIELSGLAIYGGVLAATLGSVAVWFIFRKKQNPLDRITFAQMFDLFFIFILLGQAIGRWGNFFNGEAHGWEVTDSKWQWFPFAVKIDSEWFLATFFYESVLNFIGSGIMFWLYRGKRKSFDGFIFCFYTIWYGVTRALIEPLRTDSLMSGDLRVSQMLSFIIIIIGLSLIVLHIIKAKNANKKPFIFVRKDRLSADYFDYEKSRVSMPKRVYEKPVKKEKKK